MRSLLLTLVILLAAESVAFARQVDTPVRPYRGPEVGLLKGRQGPSQAPPGSGARAPGPMAATPAKPATYRILLEGETDALAARVVDAGGRVLSARRNLVHAEVDRQALAVLAADGGIPAMQVSRPLRPLLNLSREVVGVNLVNRGEVGDVAHTGKGVIVGVVDTGIDIRHNAFRYPNGDTRILSVWDQTFEYTDGSGRPAGFDYGAECSAEEINAQLNGVDGACLTDDASPIDNIPTQGHGTHVAGIIASDDELYRGMAPDASIIAVRAQFEEGRILDGVDYILNKAADYGRPVVVNLSLGTSDGAHDGTSLIERELAERTGPGRIIVAAAGNEAFNADNFYYNHASVNFTGNGGEVVYGPLLLADSAQAGSDAYSLTLSLWDSGASVRDIYIAALQVQNGSFVALNAPDFRTPDSTGEPLQFAIEGDGRTLAYAHLVAGLSPLNQRMETRLWLDRCADLPCAVGGTIDSSITGFASLDWALVFRDDAPGTLDMWPVNLSAYFREETVAQVTGGGAPWNRTVTFKGGDNVSTITIPATAEEIIAVGSMVTRREWVDINGRPQPPASLKGAPLGALSEFSSLGPATDGRVKPDLTAPGEWIASAHSLRENMIPSSLFIAEQFTLLPGTSMAAPHVAGVIALMLERNPRLAPADLTGAQGLLARGAQSTEFSGTLPNNEWGYGLLDAAAIFALPDFANGTELDVTGPTVSEARVTVSGFTVRGRWRTNEPATSVIVLRDGDGRDITGSSRSHVLAHDVSARARGGDTYTVFLRSTDLAGNTKETRIRDVTVGDCGCYSTAGPGTGDLAVALLTLGIAALAFRRRTAAPTTSRESA